MKTLMIAALLLWCLSTSAQAQVSTVPSSPRYQETVRVRVPQVFNDPASAAQSQYNTVNGRATVVSMSGNRITIVLTVATSGFPTTPSAYVDIPIGQFPVGTYEVVVSRQEPTGAPFGKVGSTTFTVGSRQATDPLWNNTDMWWDPTESGWGLNVTQHGSGKIFASWLVYDADRGATWFVVSDGVWTDGNTYRGAVYQTTGPYYGDCTVDSCSRPFDPSTVVTTPVGELILSFHPLDASSASMVTTINGKTIRKSLQRVPF